jgi:hypothetical protein
VVPPETVGAAHEVAAARRSVNTPVALTHLTLEKEGTKGVPEAGIKVTEVRSGMVVVSGVSAPVRPGGG